MGILACQVDVQPDQTPDDAETWDAIVRVRVSLAYSEDPSSPVSAYGITPTFGGVSASNTGDFPIKVIGALSDRPKPVPPDKVWTPGIFDPWPVYFIDENDKDLRSKQLEDLRDVWAARLKREEPDLFDAISRGLCMIQLWGYASTTGKHSKNYVLALERIQSVASAVRSNFPRDANLSFFR